MWMNFFEEWITVFRWEGACPKVVVSSDEAGAHRKTVSRRLTQLRGANAGRRRMHCGRPYSGEADVVGVMIFLKYYPPAENTLTRGKISPVPQSSRYPKFHE